MGEINEYKSMTIPRIVEINTPRPVGSILAEEVVQGNELNRKLMEIQMRYDLKMKCC